MKGVSTIIAVILLLMITVALMTLFWSFSSGVFGYITLNANDQTRASVTRAGTEFTILNAINKTDRTNIDVTIRNSGTQDIDAGTLVAFVDNSAASDSAAGKISPGSAISFNVASPFSMATCKHVIRLSIAYASDAEYVIKCPQP